MGENGRASAERCGLRAVKTKNQPAETGVCLPERRQSGYLRTDMARMTLIARTRKKAKGLCCFHQSRVTPLKTVLFRKARLSYVIRAGRITFFGHARRIRPGFVRLFSRADHSSIPATSAEISCPRRSPAASAAASTSLWECLFRAIPVAIFVMQAIPAARIPR